MMVRMPALWNPLTSLIIAMMFVYVRSLTHAVGIPITRTGRSLSSAGLAQPGRCFSATSICLRVLQPKRSAGPRLCDAADADGIGDLPQARQQLEYTFSLSSAAAASSKAWRSSVLERHAGVIADLPLWRVQWVALPGNLQILNVIMPAAQSHAAGIAVLHLFSASIVSYKKSGSAHACSTKTCSHPVVMRRTENCTIQAVSPIAAFHALPVRILHTGQGPPHRISSYP
mmetsp:Transcript_55705/g.121298  ORF Transcript_55705/g.121298 Transcript_55705/m.121298 type:complete len:229 (+) Transcript_55705:87-773(+)